MGHNINSSYPLHENMNSENKKWVLAEAMAWLEEKEAPKDNAHKEQENSEEPDTNSELPFL
ncbi:MAG: hypothetical protein KBT12_09000 [Bacteroidales bacterium]|nr:hypothetical protein [Candidatus Physcousia equi]